MKMEREKVHTSLHDRVVFEIYSEICRYYGVSMKSVNSKLRDKDIVIVRHMASVVTRRVFNGIITKGKIADIIGGRNHCSINHSEKTIDNLVDTEMNVKVQYYDCIEIARKVFEKYSSNRKDGSTIGSVLRGLLKTDYHHMKQGIESLLANNSLEIEI